MAGSGMFDNFERKLQEEVRREFRNSETGRLLSAMERAAHAGDDVKSRAAKVAKYAKRPFMQAIFDDLLSQFGPVGSVIKSLLRPGGSPLASVQRELLAAKSLIEAFGGTVNLPSDLFGGDPVSVSGSSTATTTGGTLGGMSEQLDDASRLREAARRQEERELQERIDRNVANSQASRSQPIPGQIEVHIGGRKRFYRDSDPILTGEMIPVSSSNVHSIGYQFNWEQPHRGELLVRFLQKRGDKSLGPGPLYSYADIHPDLFDAFRDAASKGRWVWDRLRIRGTVTGHQKRYKLIGVVNGYVPRQAVRFGGNQYFVQRQLQMQSQKTGRRATLSSSLPDQRVGPYEPNRQNILNRGMPNRGAPNRGR
jgi:hypothetical protein